MEICLMIEGQEDVTWEDWRAIAAACEEHGVGTLVPLRPLPLGRRPARARLARRLDDDRGAGRGHRAACAWGRWSRRRPFATRRCWRSRWSPPTTSPAAGSSSGIGAGWWEREHEAYGIPMPEVGPRMDALEEQLQLVRGYWESGPFSFEGDLLLGQGTRRAAEAGPAAAAAADPRRQRRPTQPPPRGSLSPTSTTR